MILKHKTPVNIPAKRCLYLVVQFLICSSFVGAQTKEISIYKGIAPGSETWNWQERKSDTANPLKLAFTYNVSKPTLIPVYPETGTANGSAVIICMGGSLTVLPIDRGLEIAKDLASKGVTAFVLKYRLAHSATTDPYTEWDKLYKENPALREELIKPIWPLALNDLKNAIILLKTNAGSYGIDSARIGVIGISAGSKLTANLAYDYDGQTRPAFLGLMSIDMSNVKRTTLKEDTPPVFIAAAADDKLDVIPASLEFYNEWLRNKHQAELHLYVKGTHFLWEFPATDWVSRLVAWMQSLGFCQKNK